MLTTRSRFVLPMALLTMLGAPGRPVAAQSPATTATPRPDNYYAAGNHVSLAGPMEGDVVVAGRTVVIGQPVAGDILAAGWNVMLSAAASDDVRMAAATVTIDAKVVGDLTVAGGDVTTGAATVVSGRAWITGDTVRVDGTFERALQIAARSAQIDGEVRQPLLVVADRLQILPGARILGPVTYRGVNPAVVDAGAQLASPIAFEPIQPREAQNARAWPAFSTVLFAAHLLIAGLLALHFVPTFEPSVVSTMRQRPGTSLLAGFLLLVTVPAAAAALIVSVFGLPFGLALGMCYLMALFAGVLATAFFVGDLEARLFRAGSLTTRGQHAMLLLAGVLTLAVLRLLIGSLVIVAGMLFGLGALTIWLYHLYSQRPASA